VFAAARFVRIGWLLDDQQNHSAGGVRAELILSAALGSIVAALSIFFRARLTRPDRSGC
jgi:putative membrane protein